MKTEPRLPSKRRRRTAYSAGLVVLLALLTPATSAWADWTEHVVPAVGPDDDVLSVAITQSAEYDALFGHDFYITYEVRDAVALTHVLYLQKWNGSFWAAPVALGDSLVPILSNPSIAASPGHVTVVGHEEMANGCLALKEYDYEIDTGTVDATRILDDGDTDPAIGCEDTGHSHIVWSPSDSTYHACWTRKEGGAAGDGVFCSKRGVSPLVWDAPTGVAASDRAQDHVTLAVNSLGNRRVAYHDDTALGNSAQEVKLRMFRSGAWYDYNTFALPQGAAPQPGMQQRPFVALESSGKMHVTWEDGPVLNRVVKYARCLNGTPNGCDTGAEWEFNNVAISEAAALHAHFPHLVISSARTWISYQQALANGVNDVAVLHRCVNAAFNGAWTISDPYPPDDLDEYTEEYGTPHIATRLLGNIFIVPPTQIGTVTLRQVPSTARYEAVLYTRSEPVCP
jgi:hypothetical protein